MVEDGGYWVLDAGIREGSVMRMRETQNVKREVRGAMRNPSLSSFMSYGEAKKDAISFNCCARRSYVCFVASLRRREMPPIDKSFTYDYL